MFCNILFENLAVYDIIWKNNVEPDRPQMTPPPKKKSHAHWTMDT